MGTAYEQTKEGPPENKVGPVASYVAPLGAAERYPRQHLVPDVGARAPAPPLTSCKVSHCQLGLVWLLGPAAQFPQLLPTEKLGKNFQVVDCLAALKVPLGPL